MHICDIWSIIKLSQGDAVLLKPRNMEVVVPIFIGGELEIQSILIAMEGIRLSRPMTHDLFLNMLNQVNLSIRKTEIFELKNDVFHARLVITGGEYTNDKPLVLDSRPSDAIAVTVRKKCPIFIACGLINKVGISLDFFVETMEEKTDNQQPQPEGTGYVASLDELHSGFNTFFKRPEVEPAVRRGIKPLSTNKNKSLFEQLEQAIAEEEYEQAAEIRDLIKKLKDKTYPNLAWG